MSQTIDLGALEAEFTKNDAEAQVLLGKQGFADGDMENLQRLNKRNDEILTLRDLEKQRVERAEKAGKQSAWESTSAGRPPFGGASPAPGVATGRSAGNGVMVEGIIPSGFMELNGSIANGVAVEDYHDTRFRPEAFVKCRNKDYTEAFWKQARSPFGTLTNKEQAALQEGIDTEGGYLAPEQMLDMLIQKKPTPTRVAGRVNSITIGRDSVSIPKVNYSTDDIYTTGMRATWTGEIPASATVHRVTDPVFGSVRIPVYTVMMSLLITRDFLEDSMIDIQGWITGKFSETLDLLRDNMVLNGTGVGQPTGILTNVDGTGGVVSVHSGDTNLLTGDGIISLTEALPEQYDENAILVFNKTSTGKAIRLMKDGDGRPLFNYGSQDNGYGSSKAKEINGYDYIWSGFMPNVAANAYPIIFGDLRGYTLVNRIGFSVQIIRELYAETNQVLVLGRARFGGAPTEEWRMRVQKCAA